MIDLPWNNSVALFAGVVFVSFCVNFALSVPSFLSARFFRSKIAFKPEIIDSVHFDQLRYNLQAYMYMVFDVISSAMKSFIRCTYIFKLSYAILTPVAINTIVN